MAAKVILFLCAQALPAQFVLGQCFGPAFDSRFNAPNGLPNREFYGDPGYGSAFEGRPRGSSVGCGTPAIAFSPTSGGDLIVSSSSAFYPVGISIASENVYDGTLTATGELPFIGTVGVDGVLTSVGVGAVNYGCGNGDTYLISERIPSQGLFPLPIPAPATNGIGRAITPAGGYGSALGPRAGWIGRGCGRGL